MPYTQYTLNQFITQISQLLDDTTQVYWTVPEINWAVNEALYVWGALSNYWRTRGVVTLSPTDSSPFYDLSVLLPTYRARTYTLGQIVSEIQWMILESPSGISGLQSSGQVQISSILNAVQIGRNRFVLDTHLPITYHTQPYSEVEPSGLTEFPQSSVFVHRAGWQDVPSGVWTNLWRADDWDVDHNDQQWTVSPGNPQQYSESQLSPLFIQVSPPPLNSGVLEALTVDSLQMDLTGQAAPLAIPNEWVHAIKYAALSYLFTSNSQLFDPMRAQYAEQRYQQSMQAAKLARSITRVTVNGVNVTLDSLFNLDASYPAWRNANARSPIYASALYDMLVIPSVDTIYGASVDLVQSAPVPALGGNMPLGIEELDAITSYVKHILSFKCGGSDFKSTIPAYDSFMSAIAGRKGITTAKIKYFTPLFGQPQKEWAQRPDKVSNA